MDDEGNFVRLEVVRTSLQPLNVKMGFLSTSVNIPEPIIGRGHHTKHARKVYTGEGKWED